jgi:hypothetical protein
MRVPTELIPIDVPVTLILHAPYPAGSDADGHVHAVVLQRRALAAGMDGNRARFGAALSEHVFAGAIRDFKLAANRSLGLGGLFAINFVPDGLREEYGGSNPLGAMGFVRLKVG